MTIDLTRAAVYEREVSASLQRVWENVHDWEPLPWLHAQAFCGIELLDSGPWGWRARVQLTPRELDRHLVIELRCEEGAPTYHTRTLEGPGSGSDTRTTLSARGDHRTHVRVEFWIPEGEPSVVRATGDALVTLYTGLWDQDDIMMQRRQAFFEGRLGRVKPPPIRAAVPLGPDSTFRARLPYSVEVEGQRFRLRESEGQLVAPAALCPHLGGPLEEAEIVDGYLVCPWHGYRFSLTDGSNPDGRRCAMATPPRVEIDGTGNAHLVFDSAEPGR